MRHLVVACLLLLACKPEIVTTDTREPIDILYVTGPELAVHAAPNDASPMITKYENGEGVSVMSKKGEWVEVRFGDRTGWAHAADLGSGAQAREQQANPQVRFRRFPSPVSAPAARGEIYLEADVNTDGDVVGIRILENTTGSVPLAVQNAAALQAAKFYPIVKAGERKPFKYYHKVTY